MAVRRRSAKRRKTAAGSSERLSPAAVQALRERSDRNLAEARLDLDQRLLLTRFGGVKVGTPEWLARLAEKKSARLPNVRSGDPARSGPQPAVTAEEYKAHVDLHPNQNLSDQQRAKILTAHLRKPITRYAARRARVRFERGGGDGV